MGLITFFVIVGVSVVAGYLLIQFLAYFAPNHPPIIDKIVWGAVILVVVVVFIQAVGLDRYDPKIPSLGR